MVLLLLSKITNDFFYLKKFTFQYGVTITYAVGTGEYRVKKFTFQYGVTITEFILY